MKSVQIRSFLLSAFHRIGTEYLELLRKSPYSVRIRENTDQKKLRIWTLFIQWFISNLFMTLCKTRFWFSILYFKYLQPNDWDVFEINYWITEENYHDEVICYSKLTLANLESFMRREPFSSMLLILLLMLDSNITGTLTKAVVRRCSV